MHTDKKRRRFDDLIDPNLPIKRRLKMMYVLLGKGLTSATSLIINN